MTLEARVSFFDTNSTRRTHPQHAESNQNKQALRNSKLCSVILSYFESPMGPLGPLGPWPRPRPVILEAWRFHFCNLGRHLDDPWDPGGTLQHTLGSELDFR